MSDTASEVRPAHADHFASLEQQTHAAHLGMWLFLASEILLFAGLFVLYAAARVEDPHGFAIGLAHAKKTIGSLNTAILLCSSYTVASAVLSLRARKRGRTVALLLVTMALGLTFTGLKLFEYRLHFAEGIRPGAQGEFFTSFPQLGVASFWNLYYVMTGLHVVHVLLGLSVLAWMTWKVARGKIAPPHDYPLSLAAMLWHLVDIVWIFLWPLFYLTSGG